MLCLIVFPEYTTTDIRGVCAHPPAFLLVMCMSMFVPVCLLFHMFIFSFFHFLAYWHCACNVTRFNLVHVLVQFKWHWVSLGNYDLLCVASLVRTLFSSAKMPLVHPQIQYCSTSHASIIQAYVLFACLYFVLNFSLWIMNFPCVFALVQLLLWCSQSLSG